MSKPSGQCKISMLWNWYTIDSCFLASSWHVKSRGMFAGTCIGIFFWTMAYCWWRRVVAEFDRKMSARQQPQPGAANCCCDDDISVDSVKVAHDLPKPGENFLGPLAETLSHKWLFDFTNAPSLPEHGIRSVMYLMEWACSYLIMLMWMYYNGYVIITMILGYFFGQLFFNYTPLSEVRAQMETDEMSKSSM